MATLKNHSGMWLRDDAAAEFNRAEDDHGVFVVNSAGRSVAEQNGLIYRWDQGGTYNRPPYLYPPARPAEASNHVADGGKAIDIGDWRRFAVVCLQYGFVHSYPDGDPVHFDFVGKQGTYKEVVEVEVYQAELIRLGYDLGKWGADNDKGPMTTAALKLWQDSNGLVPDGLFGPRSKAKMFPEPAPAPAKSGYPLISSANVGRIGDVRGLQKIARLYGYKGDIDNIWGPGSTAGFQRFLNGNYGGSVTNWLRKRWGYVGNDQLGPVMTAALQRANVENMRAL